ncbi:MAG TPA: uracil-DNA glycosylase family protein [Ignavibacteriaceae bacterium]|nr:uracil-DNA glycosylase family protein [Ignavibacteriaceae bacterium]
MNLKTPDKILKGISIINPYESGEVRKIVNEFFTKFYSDNKERLFMIGINPGRFGGGLTGISFTDPVALREYCGIQNNLGSKTELSSKFIYEMIAAFGGAEKFFSKVFMTALFPLALTQNGNNFNYYDDKKLFNTLKPEIKKSLETQIRFGSKKEKVLILGKKNAEFFNLINKDLGIIKNEIVLDHPRFIMQYKQRFRKDYIKNYIAAID